MNSHEFPAFLPLPRFIQRNYRTIKQLLTKFISSVQVGKLDQGLKGMGLGSPVFSLNYW
jgi:hypothetical protein